MLKLTQNALILFPAPLRVLGRILSFTDILNKPMMTGYSYISQSKNVSKLIKYRVKTYKKLYKNFKKIIKMLIKNLAQ